MTPGQLSLTVGGVRATVAEGWPGALGTEMSAGQVICSGAVQFTVTSSIASISPAAVEFTPGAL